MFYVFCFKESEIYDKYLTFLEERDGTEIHVIINIVV